jgi:hypothetical protein
MAEKVIRGTASTMKKAVQLALGPDLDTIKKDLTDLKGEVRVIGVKQDEMDKRLNTRIDAVGQSVGEMDKRLSVKIDSLSEKVDLIKDVERLKIEVAELMRRR